MSPKRKCSKKLKSGLMAFFVHSLTLRFAIKAFDSQEAYPIMKKRKSYDGEFKAKVALN